MESKTQFYLVAADSLPEIFLKVAEANRLLRAGEASTAADAVKRTPKQAQKLKLRQKKLLQKMFTK